MMGTKTCTVYGTMNTALEIISNLNIIRLVLQNCWIDIEVVEMTPLVFHYYILIRQFNFAF